MFSRVVSRNIASKTPVSTSSSSSEEDRPISDQFIYSKTGKVNQLPKKRRRLRRESKGQEKGRLDGNVLKRETPCPSSPSSVSVLGGSKQQKITGSICSAFLTPSPNFRRKAIGLSTATLLPQRSEGTLGPAFPIPPPSTEVKYSEPRTSPTSVKRSVIEVLKKRSIAVVASGS